MEKSSDLTTGAPVDQEEKNQNTTPSAPSGTKQEKSIQSDSKPGSYINYLSEDRHCHFPSETLIWYLLTCILISNDTLYKPMCFF